MSAFSIWYSLWSTYKVLNPIFVPLILKEWKLLSQLKCNIMKFRILRRETDCSLLVKSWRGMCVFKILPKGRKRPGGNIAHHRQGILKGCLFWSLTKWKSKLLTANYIYFLPRDLTRRQHVFMKTEHLHCVCCLLCLLDFHLALQRHWQCCPGQTSFGF